MIDKPWSTCSPHELLDEAQSMYLRDAPEACAALIGAAQVQAQLSLEWTIENRLLHLSARP